VIAATQTNSFWKQVPFLKITPDLVHRTQPGIGPATANGAFLGLLNKGYRMSDWIEIFLRKAWQSEIAGAAL
jgi:hypothetical protein